MHWHIWGAGGAGGCRGGHTNLSQVGGQVPCALHAAMDAPDAARDGHVGGGGLGATGAGLRGLGYVGWGHGSGRGEAAVLCRARAGGRMHTCIMQA